ncbi:MAG: ACT domain-containing protein [Cyanobacteria bacterium SZAS LIN-2]|nr:ACT domain-containing protein [Cyanobacteria bacterium SZAS LIN-3]MBS1996061.1 ACT domain-containing protein [Cyanobacteria bacterium SZAS LIN-2]MBS2010168.1 ACT domain-containing protein [Cyanobacteria bacterium SZAS TMP-1]
MKFIVNIRLNNAEGAMERVLGRLRARCFEVSSMSAERSHDRAHIDARLTIEGQRAAEPVIKQLEKLYDVQSLRVQFAEGGNHGWQYPVERQSEVCLPL